MGLSAREKDAVKEELVRCLSAEKEIWKIVIFGSFPHAADPHDLDVAIFQDSSESYLPLALKYRRKTRSIAHRIPLDILPLRSRVSNDPFLRQIAQGEVIYER